MGLLDLDIRFVGLGLLLAAAILFALGFLIIRRITSDPDEGPDHWRSHHR